MDPLTALLATEAKRRGTRLLLRKALPLLAALVVAGFAFTALLVPSTLLAPPPSVFAQGGPALAGPSCGPNLAPAASAGASVGVGAVDPVTVARAAHRAGWRGADLVTAVAVAYAESSLRADAYNPAAGGNRGLWQINSVHQALLAAGDWRDPDDNAVMAFAVWTDAGGWRPWEAYTTGAHLRYLPQAREAVTALAGDTPAAGASAACVAAGAPGTVADAGDGPQGADGLRPRAAAAKATALQVWGCTARPDPCVATVGGYARRTIAGTGVLSDHATGRATDIMIPAWSTPAGVALGDEIADYFVTHGPQLGVRYVIWRDRITSLDRRGWRPYRHPSGSTNPTLAHRDHVHISFH